MTYTYIYMYICMCVCLCIFVCLSLCKLVDKKNDKTKKEIKRTSRDKSFLKKTRLTSDNGNCQIVTARLKIFFSFLLPDHGPLHAFNIHPYH